MTNTNVHMLKMCRKGGNVSRYHTQTLAKPQDVAQHSFNAALIADALSDIVSDVDPLKVIRYMLVHDVPEVDIGDSPYLTKKDNHLKRALDRIEQNWVETHLESKYSTLFDEENITKNEKLVCLLADRLEAWMKMVDERMIGNCNFDGHINLSWNETHLVSDYFTDAVSRQNVRDFLEDIYTNFPS